MGVITDYLDELRKAGRRLSEVHLVGRMAERIFGGLLGYVADEWRVNPHAGEDEVQAGMPDLVLLARRNGDTLDWIVAEAKLDDAAVRDPDSRRRLWNDKRKYVCGDTVYFLWLAPRTVLVCDPTGQLETGVYLEDGCLPLEASGIRCTTDDQAVREQLDLISAHQAHTLSFLERFRDGVLPSCYISVDHETVDKLTETLRGCIASLRAYLARRWDGLSKRYEEFRHKAEELEERFESRGDADPPHIRELQRGALREKYADARRLFEVAFPVFREQQAYTRWQPDEAGQEEEAALGDIFRTNAAYVILGRLLFVRFAEDQVGPDGKPLLTRKVSNGGLKLWRQLVGAGESYIGKLVGLAFCQAGSIFQQLFSETPFDALISLDDPEFDLVLLSVLYRLNAFDFRRLDRDLLGDLYQKLLPRDLRKRLGEFYTDEEVVDYILHRTGFVEAARAGAPTILDPACGSGTFLVRAAHYLIEGAKGRGVSDEETLRIVETCVHGLDINDFAVFISRVNLLFTVFDLVVSTRRDVAFRVYEANSLASPRGANQQTTDYGTVPALPRLAPGEELRDGRYQFVVGNPPYVRAERIPEGDRRALQQAYARVTERNTDLAVYFVYRSRDWLDEGGTFGMIVPRALADAAFAAPLRSALDDANLAVVEITPLDWACHELFDSDVVPMILVFRRQKRSAGAELGLVQGLRSKADLLTAAAQPSARRRRVAWDDFTRVAATNDLTWPIELTTDDVRVFDHLQRVRRQDAVTRGAFDHPQDVGRPKAPITARLGIKLGSGAHARETPARGEAPLLRGSDVYAYFLAPASRFVDVARAEHASLWGRAEWHADAGRFTVQPGDQRGLPEAVAAVATIGITLNAAVLQPPLTAAQNTIVLAWWNELSAPIEALVGLLNSSLLRWFSFIFLRAGVAGGGRRDHTVYPRTIEALPMPGRSPEEWADKLAELAARAGEEAKVAAPLDAELWGEAVADLGGSRLSRWPIDWHDWPENFKLTAANLRVEREAPGRLRLSPKVALVAEDPAVLDFLALHIPLVVEQVGSLTRGDAQALTVPEARVIRQTLSRYGDAVAARDRARAAYLETVAEVDEVVFEAFEMPDNLSTIVRRRMEEFPLSHYAANYRKPWEPTRKPKIKIFQPGERFK